MNNTIQFYEYNWLIHFIQLDLTGSQSHFCVSTLSPSTIFFACSKYSL